VDVNVMTKKKHSFEVESFRMVFGTTLCDILAYRIYVYWSD